MPKFEKRLDEVGLTWEVTVERHFRNSGLGNDAIDPGSTDPFLIEKLMSCLLNALSRREIRPVGRFFFRKAHEISSYGSAVVDKLLIIGAIQRLV